MKRRYFAARRGQALVELAFVLPVFLLLTVAVVDFGRGVWAYNTVAFLARDGARFATIPTRGSAEIQTHVVNRCTNLLSNPCTAAVSVPSRGTCGNLAQPVVVHVAYPFEAIMASFWSGGALNLEAESQMYVEQGPVGGCAA